MDTQKKILYKKIKVNIFTSTVRPKFELLKKHLKIFLSYMI